MSLFEKPAKWSFSWFTGGLTVLLLLSLTLRFGGLERFNTLVFDEVYYVKFAHNYLSQTPFFDGHPPLSKYLLAIAIWIGNLLPFGKDAVNSLAGAPYSTWSYRWLNALTGSLIPLLISGIAYQLTHRATYALIAGLFAALDGLFLVESRYALNNVYLVGFGLAGIWFWLVALNSHHFKRQRSWLILSGLFFGASASVKWNGLWFLLGVYGLWIAARILGWIQAKRSAVPHLFPLDNHRDRIPREPVEYSPLQRLSRLRLWQLLVYFGLVPAVFYYLSWLPHLWLNVKDNFWDLQRQILQYHQQVGDGPTIHPYCSDWYTWLLMLRPVAYFYQVTLEGAPLPTGNSTLPPTAGTVIYDVHAIGNPILWWLSTAAILLVLWALFQQIFTWLRIRRAPAPPMLLNDPELAFNPTERWLVMFLAINYAANLLPWVRVTRCLFLYHYMGASVFASLAIAWMVDRWLHSSQTRLRLMGISTILVIGLAFIFWLPLYLGLPLSPWEFQLRLWFPSWV